MRIAFCLAAAAALVSLPAVAQERLLRPTDEWALTAREESCVVTRNFADPYDKPLRVEMESFGPGTVYTFTMTGEGLPLRDGRRRGIATIRYRFDPDPEWRHVGAATAYRNGTDVLTFRSGIETEAEMQRLAHLARDGQPSGRPTFQPDLQRAAAVDRFVLWYPARHDTVVQLGPLLAAVEPLHECVRGLVRKWGYDPAVLERLSSHPGYRNPGDIGQAIASAMTKNKALRRNEPFTFRLDVDDQGNLAGCTLQNPRTNAEFSNLVCQAVRDKADFIPATDADGQTVAAPVFSSMNFGTR